MCCADQCTKRSCMYGTDDQPGQGSKHPRTLINHMKENQLIPACAYNVLSCTNSSSARRNDLFKLRTVNDVTRLSKRDPFVDLLIWDM